MARRWITPSSTATFARSRDEAPLLSWDRQPLHRAPRRAGGGDARGSGGSERGFRGGWDDRGVRHRRGEQTRPFQPGGDRRAAVGAEGGVSAAKRLAGVAGMV